VSLERDLVAECRVAAKAMGAFLVELGQRRAKGSGSTIGLPDLAVLCNGKTVWIETKRAHVKGEGHGCLTVGQVAFIEKAAEQGVRVFVVDSLDGFVSVVNLCRRRAAS